MAHGVNAAASTSNAASSRKWGWALSPAAAAGLSALPHFLLLAALLVLAAAFTPWAIAASLRISSE